jgi:hypothetical protein
MRGLARDLLVCLFALALCGGPALAGGNRLAYLDTNDPYYPSRTFPKLVTPQWVGEDGVDAVVILGIDDMRGHERWEAFLRPVLDRLKKIDGRAPVSIMTCSIDPDHEHLQKWLKEGLSLETHTFDHPCPLLQKGDLARAKGTYDRCVDLLAKVPNSRPVAFRVPCCDSLNTPSPRFYAEIFNQTTRAGRFLTADTSVFNVFTADDPELPRDLFAGEGGRRRFLKYLPRDRSFVNTIENYPYPYVLGRLCWEFPCATPSDWQAQHLHKPNNELTVKDWKACLDATVAKQGVLCLVFHPHGWIKNTQLIELIDHAAETHGKRVKFLTFAEAQARLDKHLLAGQPLRAAGGGDNGVRLLDLNGDGYLDIVIGNDQVKKTRVWSPKVKKWEEDEFPVALVSADGKGKRTDAGARFGVLKDGAPASVIVLNDKQTGVWHFAKGKWVEDRAFLAGLELKGRPVLSARAGSDRGVRLRDLDGDGRCELLVGSDEQSAAFRWDAGKKRWSALPFTLPPGAAFVDGKGRDHGLRLADVNGDGRDDVVFSNEDRYGLYLFESAERGWSREVRAGKRDDAGALPLIARDGTDNGAWFHSGHLWVQNEDTSLLKDHVDRRSFKELLRDRAK